MIKITKNEIPEVLQKNQQAWTNELFMIINHYGDYKSIPEKEKDAATGKYRHDDIKAAIKNMTKGKCVFCESEIDSIDWPNIEHFYPKALYPAYCFKWSNLFPSCRKCNIIKGNTDTKNKFPIVNPEKDDPEEYFVFNDLQIESSPSSPSQEKSENTIKYCSLNRIGLSRNYAQILISFYEVEENIGKLLQEYSTLKSKKGKSEKLIKLWDSIDNLKVQADDFSSYAGYLRQKIVNSKVIIDGVKLLNDHANALGLTKPYNMEW